MAATFINVGFETAGVLQGMADGWEFVHVATAERFSEYGPRVPGTGFEDYAGGWGNDDYATEMVIQNPSQYAFYDTAPTDREDYEHEWSSNEFWSNSFSAIAEAEFDSATPQQFEDYEEEWSTNEDFLFAFVGLGTDLEAASYDSALTPETTEDFEEGWGFNHFWQTTFSEFQGDVSTVASTDIIRRNDLASWITEQEFGHLQNGQGAVVLYGSVGADGVYSISAIIGTTDHELQSSDAIATAGSPATIVRDSEHAEYDGATLVKEQYEGTWTTMVTM